jgi:transcriptional regulator of heat shock response
VRDWSAEYNVLPMEIRIIGSAINNQTRINQLEAEKHRLKQRYQKSVREINDHIKNCEEWIKRLEQDNA